MEGQINAQLHTNVIIFHKRLVTSQFGRFLLRNLQTTLGPKNGHPGWVPHEGGGRSAHLWQRTPLIFHLFFPASLPTVRVISGDTFSLSPIHMNFIIFFSFLGTRGACSINKGVDTMSIVHQMDSQSCRYHISRQITVFLFLAIHRKRSGILSQEKYISPPSPMGPLSWICTQIRLKYKIYNNFNKKMAHKILIITI